MSNSGRLNPYDLSAVAAVRRGMYRQLPELSCERARIVATEFMPSDLSAKSDIALRADVQARRAERLAGFLNHAGQAINDGCCLVLLSLSSALLAAAAWLARVESEWVDVKVKGDGR